MWGLIARIPDRELSRYFASEKKERNKECAGCVQLWIRFTKPPEENRYEK